ncbi:molybdate ABC transporter substrate-binding protein [Sedimentitalea todarodis]|uniref:Molybdate ABC transporter substrate-binding protein n=1 Tax=Sedimentitalea todarodis TaxID=1631240 RepID=A0ABU3V8T8_9RHOB|nr:molybdate ABC transporter substrate-binding protein [Sedimentitalea todarodis]MDU9002518.1 molybdate ABC transporter substrate-binding protein [Sedimentitalea todarodis]
MLHHWSRRLFLAMSLAAMITPFVTKAETPVTVFAAASLKSALDELAATYADPVHISYGGSSTLARQIQHGAPADLFISANAAWMDVLEQDGLIVAASRRTLLTNRLVLIAGPDVDPDLTIEPGFDLAAALGQDHLAMALIDAVPAGIYGAAALRSLGVWEQVAHRVAQTDNVRAALMLVVLGEAPYGVVYATDAEASPDVRVVGMFPEGSHPPIRYPAAPITGANPAPAQAFLDFLLTPEAGEVFQKHGFGLPGDGA